MFLQYVTVAFIFLYGFSLINAQHEIPATTATTTINPYDVTNGLDRNGTNVCSYEETISKMLNVSYISQRFVTEKTRTCNWFGRCKTKTRLVVRGFTSYRLETRYINRNTYYCCAGWKRNQTSCGIPKCPISCQNGGKCVAPSVCECPDGFTGKLCQIDKNECANPKINDCEQVCTNQPGGFKCSCNRGYTLNDDGKTCTDVDECSRSQSPCSCASNDGICNSQCVNTKGGYFCRCPKGYYLNSAEQCEDRNECFEDQTLCDHKCVNKPGTYECQCFHGYQYDNTAKKCVDIDECKKNNGGCSHDCVNLKGFRVCMCPKGKYLVDRTTCKDIDVKKWKTQVVCESDMMGMLACDNINAKINITSAFYGRVSGKICPTTKMGNLDCALKNPEGSIGNLCNGLPSCLVMLDDLHDPCPGVEKYAQITYKCQV